MLCLVMILVTCVMPVFSVSAESEAELKDKLEDLKNQSSAIESEIASLKAQKADQQKIKNALEKQIANLQYQINICTDAIDKNNEIIAENEKEIANKTEKMQQTIFEFKKRIRTIYMSGSTTGGLEILLGADSFSDFIALSQLTQNVSRKDKKMVDGIVAEIEEINLKIEENRALVEEQKAIKAELDIQQDKLDDQVAEISRVISSIQADNKELQTELDRLEAEYQSTLDMLYSPEGGEDTVFEGMFTWPVPGFTNRTSEYGPRWNANHAGIDIAQSGIANARVVAAASGTVTVYCNSCTHNYGKVNSNGSVYSRGCGGGYGTWLKIEHGQHDGISYRTVYAHLSPGSIAVSTGQYVNKGATVGRVGTTGRSTGYHLHFEIRQNGVPKNPMNWY